MKICATADQTIRLVDAKWPTSKSSHKIQRQIKKLNRGESSNEEVGIRMILRKNDTSQNDVERDNEAGRQPPVT